MKFEAGKEYKLFNHNGEESVRTFTVVKVSHKNMAIMVKGGIHGIFNMTISHNGDEMISLGMSDRCHLCPCATDVID